MYDSSSPGGSSSKHFVWAWGRLTPAPLLLTTSNELPLLAAGSSSSSQGIASGLVGASNGGTATPGGNRTAQLVRSRSAGPDDSAEASAASATGGGSDGGERDSSSHSHSHSHSHAAAAQCTLSPTLIEAMETNSVRAVHTAAHHTVAITRTNKRTLESARATAIVRRCEIILLVTHPLLILTVCPMHASFCNANRRRPPVQLEPLRSVGERSGGRSDGG